MIFVLTVHYKSAEWIDIQRRYLDEFLSGPFAVWTSLEGIDPAYGSRFDRVIEQRGPHQDKLNHLAAEVCDRGADDDILLFMDGDAFPIADARPVIEEALSRNSLVAVQRYENLGDIQPHPCFCAITVGEWLRLRGDWGGAATWSQAATGATISDVGGNLMRRMAVAGARWQPLLRTNQVDLHPVFFGIYGDVAYHHGAAFRPGNGARIDYALSWENPIRLPTKRLTGFVNHRYVGRRRYQERVRRLTATSQSLRARMIAGDTAWIDELRGQAVASAA